jgi:hypothetical protein
MPGKEKAFEDAHRIDPGFTGFKGGALVKTGDRPYCFVGRGTILRASPKPARR